MDSTVDLKSGGLINLFFHKPETVTSMEPPPHDHPTAGRSGDFSHFSRPAGSEKTWRCAKSPFTSPSQPHLAMLSPACSTTSADLPSQSPKDSAFFAIRELAEPHVAQQATLSRPHLAKGTLKHRKARVRARDAQHPAPGVADDARSLVHQLLHHGLDAPAQCGLAHRAVALVQRVLPHDALISRSTDRPSLAACSSVRAISCCEQKPESARNSKGAWATAQAVPRARSMLYSLSRAVLAARAQIEIQTVAACAQLQGDGAVVIDSGVGVGDAFFGGVALIHDEGVDAQWQVAAGQGPEVDCCTIDAQAQYGAVDRVGQFAPFAAHGIEALAQGGAGGHGAQAQGLVGKALLAKGFDGFEVVLAQGEHGDVALEDVAVGNPRAHWVFGIHHGRQFDALEQAPHQGQASVAAQVVGQFLDNELDWVSHLRRLHLLGAWLLVDSSLIMMEKQRVCKDQATDSGQ